VHGSPIEMPFRAAELIKFLVSHKSGREQSALSPSPWAVPLSRPPESAPTFQG
jgi:hypothetical protein